MPGSNRPFIGNIIELIERDKAVAKSEEALPTDSQWLFKNVLAPEKEIGYEPEKYQAVLYSLLGMPILTVFDPKAVQDIFISKNRLVDKTGEF